MMPLWRIRLMFHSPLALTTGLLNLLLEYVGIPLIRMSMSWEFVGLRLDLRKLLDMDPICTIGGNHQKGGCTQTVGL